jgi:natural product biosynthesis luciferase-like monooxygenase protein
MAAITNRIHLRAGSVVAPLHDPIRIAEDWAVVDVLSGGRAGISFASGWVPDDFVLASEAYTDRYDVMLDVVSQVRLLWSGRAIRRRNGAGQSAEVRILPRPIQRELPVWLTASSERTFRRAGALGVNALTTMQMQGAGSLQGNIAAYRTERERAGFDPKKGRVVVMLHTFVADTESEAIATARAPLTAYFRAHAELRRDAARNQSGGEPVNAALDDLVETSVEDYLAHRSLIGSVDSCVALLHRLRALGVDEVACLIDFGVEAETVLTHLTHLRDLAERSGLMLDSDELRRYLRQRLPDYMVPTAFVPMKALPRTSSGKVDRKALPAALPEMNSYTAPRSPTEQALSKIWSELLNLEQVGIRDNFFDIGGHSLLAMHLLARIQDKCGVSFPLRVLFETPRIEDLAKCLERLKAPGEQLSPPTKHS